MTKKIICVFNDLSISNYFIFRLEHSKLMALFFRKKLNNNKPLKWLKNLTVLLEILEERNISSEINTVLCK